MRDTSPTRNVLGETALKTRRPARRSVPRNRGPHRQSGRCREPIELEFAADRQSILYALSVADGVHPQRRRTRIDVPGYALYKPRSTRFTSFTFGSMLLTALLRSFDAVG